MGLKCDSCDKVFNNKSNLNRHMRTRHSEVKGKHECVHCQQKFTRRDNLLRHILLVHHIRKPAYKCSVCNEQFSSHPKFMRHKDKHPINSDFKLIQQAWRGTCSVYRQTFPHRRKRISTLQEFWTLNREKMENLMRNRLNATKNFKCNLVIMADIVKNKGEEEERGNFCFRTRASEIQSEDDIQTFCNDAKAYLDNKMDDLIEKGSGWTTNSLDYADLEIGDCPPLAGFCDDVAIRLCRLKDLYKRPLRAAKPKKIKNGCLLYAVASYFTDSEDADILEKFIDEKLIVSVSLPVTKKNLDKFETDNEALDFKINLLQIAADKKVYPLRASRKEAKHSINILWTELCSPAANGHLSDDDGDDEEEEDEESEEEEEEEWREGLEEVEEEEIICDDDDDDDDDEDDDDESDMDTDDKMLPQKRKKVLKTDHHYFLIPDLNSFLSHGCKHQKFFCLNCLHSFSLETALLKHQTHCFSHGPQKVIAPKEGENILKFTNYEKQSMVPFIGFYDFEAVLQPADASDERNYTPSSQIMNVQQPITFCLIILNREKEIIYRYMYTGVDCADVFVKTLLNIEPWLLEKLQRNVPMNALTEKEQKDFENASTCYICGKGFRFYKNQEPEVRVRDHDHLSGQYIGPAHRHCNLMRREKLQIPLFCHNSSNYDSHFILAALNNDVKIKHVSGLPTNMEKFKTISINSFCFLDSFAFMSSRLEDLANDLKRIPNFSYSILDQADLYSEGESDKKDLLLQKGCFPYEYITDISVLNEPKLPPQDLFYSSLANKHISDLDYQRAQTIFTKFGCKSIKNYCELYCAVDTVLLAEIVFQFREEIFRDANLDMCHYISLPQLSLDFMLKKLNLEIELLTDIDKILFVERNIRGGLSFISERFVECSEEDEEMIFIDANNLYGMSMSGCLPLRNYQWLEESHLQNTDIDWYTIDTQGKDGFILEVDLSYPDHLHLDHSSYPLAAQQFNIDLSMLSPYAKGCHEALKKEGMKYNAKKLTSTFLPRRNYVLHFANLQLYLHLGMKLEKVHRVLTFEQSNFLKPYIDYCTEKRMKSTSSFQGSVFKLLCNSLFGKFLEQQRDRINARFVSSKGSAQRNLSNPTFERFKLLNDHRGVFFHKQKQVTLNKAYAVGFTILELSKVHMYEFFYKILKPSFANISLFLTDTDSYGIKVKKRPEQRAIPAIQCLADYMDFSNYDPSHPSYNATNKNKLGLFKDETGGKQILDFIGMRSKTYCIRYANDPKLHVRTKGVSRGYRSLITMEHFRNCLDTQSQHVMKMYHIGSKNHIITTKKIRKIAFSSFDDKRYLLCPIHSVPYGSVLIDIYLANNEMCPYCYPKLLPVC